MTDVCSLHDAKAAILDYVDDRLREWANWALSGNRSGIGYPPCALEYRLMVEGHVEKSYQGLAPTPEHAPAEEIEALLCEMLAQHQKMAQVVQLYYLEEGTLKTRAKRMGIGHTLFEMYLKMGRWWLAGRLSECSAIKTLMQPFKVLKTAQVKHPA